MATAAAPVVLFMINAAARPFRPYLITPIDRPSTFNDDLAITSFRPTKHVWSGEPRRGAAFRATDATSIPGHVAKGVGPEFFLSEDIPLREEIREAMDFTGPPLPQPPPTIASGVLCENRLKRAELVVGHDTSLPHKWYRKSGHRIQSATAKFTFIAMMSLMAQFNIGWESGYRGSIGDS